MSHWRDKRSFPVLFLGLASLLLEIKSVPSVEEALRSSGALTLPLAKALQPFRVDGRRALQEDSPPAQTIPDAAWLAQREAAFFRPKDERLLSRRVVFASRSASESEPDTAWLEAGSEHGVKEGMFAVLGDALLGEITRVEPQRCLLRLPTHPASQLGARVGDVRFIAAGGRHGAMRVELASGRAFEPGGEVRGDPVPAVLGRVENAAGGRKGSFVVRPAINFKAVFGAWILSPNEPGASQSRELAPAPSQGEWESASSLWPEVSPHARGGVFKTANGKKLFPGSAVVEGRRLVGFLQRSSGGLAWLRLLGDPGLRFDSLLARDDGAVIVLPSLELGSRESGGLSLPSGPSGLGEGWLFTAGGREGVPKGILVGRVRRGEAGLFLEGNFQGLPNTVTISTGGRQR